MAMKDVVGLLGDTSKELLGLMQLDQRTRAAQATATESARQFDVGTIQTQQSNVGKMYENRFNENQKLVGEFVKALAGDPNLGEDDSFNAMMQTAQANVRSAEMDMLQNWGVEITDTTQKKLADVLNKIFDTEAKEYEGQDLRAHLTWNDNWKTILKKRLPDVDDQLLEWAWKGKSLVLPKSIHEGGGVWDWPGGLQGWVSEIAGTPADVASGIANFFLSEEDKIKNIPGGRMWMRENLGLTVGDITGKGIDVLRGKEARKLPSFLPSGDEDASLKQMEAEAVNRQRQMEAQVSLASQLDQQSIVDASTGASSPISGFYPGSTEEAGANLRNRFKDIVDAPTPLMGQQGLMNGYFAQTTPQQKQLPDLSREARAFLRKLNEYLLKYGEEEAQLMLSREYRNLKRSDKQKLEEYFTSRNESEALA